MGEQHPGEGHHEWQGNGRERPPRGEEHAQAEKRADPRKARRTRLIVIAVAAAAAVAALLWWLHARHFENTDDAQIDANISSIGSRVPGTVIAVHVQDNQPVKEGELLIELDPADLQVALAQAKASVALAEAQVKTGTADVEAARRELDQARSASSLAEKELRRARLLLKARTVPQAEFDRRSTAADSAASAVAAGQKRVEERAAGLSARQAQLDLAHAQLKQAGLNLGYARVTAPVAGIAGKRSVNVGDRIEPGQPLVQITQTGDLWVTANFRETQIRLMKPGQPATVHVDSVSRDYTGKVESFAGATGSRYSLMPPENASGNYVKVVQRLPVRIRLDPGQPELERLRPGMSVEPQVRVR